MVGFDKETQAIIDRHKADFNCNNFSLKTEAAFRKYLQTLGGIFARMADFKGPVKNVEELLDVITFVVGLMTIYGFDYYNGKTYVRWTGGSPFYVGANTGACNAGRIEDLCTYKSKTTCCNWGIDTILFKAGILPAGKQKYCTQASYGQLITRKADLRPGDIVHFYRDQKHTLKVDDPSTYGKSGWHHVVMVYAVTSDAVMVCDLGSRFQRNKGQFLYVVPAAGKEFGGTYGTSDKWLARRLVDLPVTDHLYRVRLLWGDPSSQIGAYEDLNNAKAAVEQMRTVTGKSYTVYNSNGVPVWPFYRVRRSWEDSDSQIGAYAYYKNAAFAADMNGLNVYDNWGDLLHEGAFPELPVIVSLAAGTVLYEAPGGFAMGAVAAGKYTIVSAENGFGELKSGAGWIDLKKANRPE